MESLPFRTRRSHECLRTAYPFLTSSVSLVYCSTGDEEREPGEVEESAGDVDETLGEIDQVMERLVVASSVSACLPDTVPLSDASRTVERVKEK